jgi:hypothetical protein
MIECKVVRMTSDGKKLYEEFLVFPSIKAADAWAEDKNEERSGSVVDLEVVPCDYEY